MLLGDLPGNLSHYFSWDLLTVLHWDGVTLCPWCPSWNLNWKLLAMLFWYLDVIGIDDFIVSLLKILNYDIHLDAIFFGRFPWNLLTFAFRDFFASRSGNFSGNFVTFLIGHLLAMLFGDFLGNLMTVLSGDLFALVFAVVVVFVTLLVILHLTHLLVSCLVLDLQE